ncbi:hypothetical protein ACS0TY_020783 [Phlomoides rotata]
MRSITRTNLEFLIMMRAKMHRTVVFMAIAFAFIWFNQRRVFRNNHRRRFSMLDRIPGQISNLRDLVNVSDEDCKNVLRMDRVTFSRFCNLLQTSGGLTNSKHVTVKEKVAIFLCILAHHTKNRFVRYKFKRPGQTISKHFHFVLQCVLKLHSLFLVQPQPVPEDSTDPRWGKFKRHVFDGKGVVGAVDGEKGKAPRGRRSCTRAEEDALIQCLLGIMNDGWKADNGFKTGKSGIGWNSTSNTLNIIDETVWDAQRKANSGVKSLRYKSFLYYDSWLDIFRKDRATGEHAADPVDLANEFLKIGSYFEKGPMTGSAGDVSGHQLTCVLKMEAIVDPDNLSFAVGPGPIDRTALKSG